MMLLIIQQVRAVSYSTKVIKSKQITTENDFLTTSQPLYPIVQK